MKILIAGLAKTGTTGLLYLIANSFEKPPKLIFEPRVCPADATNEAGDVIAKILIGAELDANSFAHFDKKITIVRDPRDRIVSALLYSQFHANYLGDAEKVRLVRECLEHKETEPSSVSVRHILRVLGEVSGIEKYLDNHRRQILKSMDLFDQYVQSMPSAFVYKYEEFVSGNYAPLEKYLGMTLGGSADVPDRLNRVVRTKGFGDWRNWFTFEDLEVYKPLLSAWLGRYGYDAADWTLNENPTIDSGHCSGYFMRLVEERSKNPPVKIRGKTSAERQLHLHAKDDFKDVAVVRGEAEIKGKVENRLLTGNLVRAEPGLVAGWAIGSNPNEPVSVELIVNGNPVAQMVADRLRPGLRDRGFHPTGLCGFAFRFNAEEQLKVGDEVIVKSTGEDLSFTNCPRRVEMATGPANV